MNFKPAYKTPAQTKCTFIYVFGLVSKHYIYSPGFPYVYNPTPGIM